MTKEQFICALWNGQDISKRYMLDIDNISDILFDVEKPITMVDLSYLSPRNDDLFLKSFICQVQGNKLVFNHEGVEYSNDIRCFKANRL